MNISLKKRRRKIKLKWKIFDYHFHWILLLRALLSLFVILDIFPHIPDLFLNYNIHSYPHPDCSSWPESCDSLFSEVAAIEEDMARLCPTCMPGPRWWGGSLGCPDFHNIKPCSLVQWCKAIIWTRIPPKNNLYLEFSGVAPRCCITRGITIGKISHLGD